MIVTQIIAFLNFHEMFSSKAISQDEQDINHATKSSYRTVYCIRETTTKNTKRWHVHK